MHSAVERRLKLAIAGMVLVSYFGLMSTFRYGASILLVPLFALAVMPLGEWLDGRFKAYKNLTSLIIVVYILFLAFIIQQSSLLDAVVSLVIFVQVYSLVHRKHERNYWHIMLMSFFLLLAASVLSPRSGIALVFFFFVMFSTWSLSLLEMFHALRLGTADAEAEVRVRALSARMGPLRPTRVFDLKVASLLLGVGLGVASLTTLLFFAVPRTEAGMLASSGMSPQFVTGLSTEVDLSKGGFLQGNAAPLMHVQFPEEPGGAYLGPKLWRSTALDSYTGRKWTRRGLITQASSADVRLRRFKSDPRATSREGLDRATFSLGRLVYQEIYLDRPPEVGVPALPMVKSIMTADASSKVEFRWDVTGDFTAAMSSAADRGTYLRVWSEVFEPSPEALRASSQDYRAVMVPSDYRHLTYHNLLPETLALVEEITADSATPYDKVMALENRLSFGEFTYTKTVPVLPQDHPLDAFILKEKAGHCQLFASALALMVRSLDIPARVVSGYRGGLWDEADRSYTITNDMAHLWTEVYFPDVGWVAFDPSPPEINPGGLSIGSFVRAYSRLVLKARMLWMRYVVTYTPAEEDLLLQGLAVKTFRAFGGRWTSLDVPEQEVSVLRMIAPLLIAAIVLVAFAMLALAALRTIGGRPRRSRYSLTTDQRRAVRLHKLVTRRLRRLGIECAGKTVEEIGNTVTRANLNDSGTALHLLAAYNAARFGDQSFSAADLARLGRLVRGLRPAG